MSAIAKRKRLNALSSARLRQFHAALRQWFQKNQRKLPWRETRDPYAVMVSEIMLQQTRVGTVIPYYYNWLRQFPDVHTLARASRNEVLCAWQGLGYYGRAHHLHRAAKVISRRFHGEVPRNPADLQLLPGIGRYTANAIAAFAFGQSLPIVETNTARVLARLFNIQKPVDSTAGRKHLWEVSGQLVPVRGAGRFHAAMMDLAVLVCTGHNPQCRICPVRTFCKAPTPAALPVKGAPSAAIALTESHIFSSDDKRVLLERCHHRWTGMWMLPRALGVAGDPIHRSRFSFTNHAITLQVFRKELGNLDLSRRWFHIRKLHTIPIPSPHRRAIASILATVP